MSHPLRVAVLTGKRGGFGAMKPMLRLLRDSDVTELQLIVTDQHLNKAFGATLSEVEQEFNVAAAVDMGEQDGTAAGRAMALGRCMSGMSETLAKLNPDVLVLYGDRGEVMSAAVAAVHQRLPIAHLQGGDISGNVDETIRHAVTKLSHLHFASCEDSAQRIRAMGEETWRVHMVGDNHVDLIVAGEYTSADILSDTYNIPVEQAPIIFLLHPETVRDRNHYEDAKTVLESVAKLNRRTFAVYPCSDHGYHGIITALSEYENHPHISIHKNIIAQDFWGLMHMADVMIGNSSAGLVECPYFDLPAVNIGERQLGRFRGKNVIDAQYDSTSLDEALNKALHDTKFRDEMAGIRPFGEGQAGQLIFETLLKTDFSDPKIFEKRMTF